MKVKGLDGRDYIWNPTSHKRRKCSVPHLRARLLLTSLFPNEQRLEEVYLPGAGRLYADFYLPGRKLVVEVMGRQHNHYVGHFHRHRLGFLQSNQRDQKKREWAELNGLVYVDLPGQETDDEWTRRIRQASDCSGPARPT